MATMKVNGMSCEHCKAAVEKAVNSLPGVKNAVVSLENKEVTWEESGDLPVPMELVKETIRDLGYDPL